MDPFLLWMPLFLQSPQSTTAGTIGIAVGAPGVYTWRGMCYCDPPSNSTPPLLPSFSSFSSSYFPLPPYSSPLLLVLCDIIFTGISIISVLLSRYDNYHDNFMKKIPPEIVACLADSHFSFQPNKFVVFPEHCRGRSQFRRTTCFMFITVSRLWRSHFSTTWSQLAA